MADRHFIVATAGHVDHGKSALVRALTGTDPDRLPEEKARGITIDLGFAHLALPGLDLGLVDVPGHEDFVKNMVAGVGSVDLALFVVAADDGWMPQTEEHLQILAYLGVHRAVVALTKSDLTPAPALAADEVRARLRGTPFEHAPIIPTSTLTGQGFGELRAALAVVLADAPTPRDLGKPRLPVDRVFTLRGVGTIATGTLTGGTVARGAAVVAQPSGRTGHVRGVQSHGHELDTAACGTRAAFNLPDLAATGDGALARGEVLTSPGLGRASAVLDVRLTRFDRPPAGARAAAPLRDGTHVRVHHGSSHCLARVRLREGKTLAPGASAVAQLRCDAPVFAFAGDRLVLRDGAGRATLAGGTVLDPDSSFRRFRTLAQRRFLTRLAGADPHDAAAAVSAVLERDRAVATDALLVKSAFSAPEIAAAVATLAAAGSAALPMSGLAVDAAWWQSLRQRAAGLVDDWHRTHPEQVGLPLDRLRAGLGRALPLPPLLDALVAALVQPGGFVHAGNVLRRASHRPALPPALHAAGERIRAALAARPLEPPSVTQLAPDAGARQALRFLRDTGEVVELSPELVLPAETFQRGARGGGALPALAGGGHGERPAPDARHDAPGDDPPPRTPRPRGRHPPRGRPARTARLNSAARGSKCGVSMYAIFLIGVGSALGGIARFGASRLVAALFGETFPWGTLFVNVTGSFVIGLYFTLTVQEGGRLTVTKEWREFVTVGICGGYTTFSSFSLQTLSLMQRGEWFTAGMNAFGSVALCLLAVWLGVVCALALNPRA